MTFGHKGFLTSYSGKSKEDLAWGEIIESWSKRGEVPSLEYEIGWRSGWQDAVSNHGFTPLDRKLTAQ